MSATTAGTRWAPRTPRSLTDDARPDRWAATTALVAAGLDLRLIEGITTGTLLALALTPVWLTAVRRYRGAAPLLGLGVLAVLSGQWLAELAQVDHVVSGTDRRASALLLIGSLAVIGVLLWARTLMSLRRVGLAYGAGLVLQLAAVPPNPVNPWKHGIAFTLGILLLAATSRGRARAFELPALAVLAGASAPLDSRSAFATFALAAVLVAWQKRPVARTRGGSAAATLALFAVVSACVYWGGTALMVEGYLGQQTQERSVSQLETSGSVIVGGRPEWGATLALVAHRPQGFGTGVHADLEDLLVAKSGMAEIRYDPDNGYVERYMFGGPVKLHAVLPDLWAGFGVLGLVFGLAVLGSVVWSLAGAVAQRVASGLVVYVSCLTLWNLAFGPIYTSLPSLALTLGLLLLPRVAQPTGRAGTAGAALDVAPVPASALRGDL